METAEEGHAAADLCEGEDAGAEAVVEVGGEVGDFVGEIDELRFERRELAEEVVGELGMGAGGIVARVLDDAFADGEGEVEAAEGGRALFEPGDDAQGVEIVIEAEAVSVEGAVEGLFSGVAEGRMADVVGKGEGFGQLGIEAEGMGQGAGDLCDFEGVGEAAAEMIAGGIVGQAGEDLGFASEAAEGAGMEDAGGVSGEWRAIRVGRLGVSALCERTGAGDGDARGQDDG